MSSLLEQASLIITPNGVKAGKLYGLKGADLDVVRATTATRVNSTPLIETVANNVARLDYTGGSCPSILVEPQRTNLFTYSEQFDDASWLKNNATITANYLPSIIQNKNSFLFTSTGGVPFLSKTISSTANTQTFFVRKGNYDFVQILNFGSSSAFANFDINNKTLGSKGTLTPSSFIEDLGNGWSKISAFFNTTATVSRLYFANSINAPYGGGDVSTSGLTLELAASQSEQGSNATSYIPTVASAVTRNADVISKTGIANLIGQTEGTLFVDTKYSASSSTSARWFRLLGVSNEIGLALNGLNSVRAFINGASDTITTSPKTNLGVKLAFAYNNSGVVLFVNGVQYALPNGGSQIITSLNSIEINPPFTVFNEAVLNSALLFKTRLSNDELATLTTL